MTTCKNPDGGHAFRRCRDFARQLVIAIIVLALAPGCRPKSEGNGTASSDDTGAVRLSSIHSRRDIERVFRLGMTTNEILARLGPCLDITGFPDGTLLWTYWLHPFPEEGTNNGLYLLAARLSITNGRVGHVGYLRAAESVAQTQEALSNGMHIKGLPDGSVEPYLLTLSIVSSNRIDGACFVDSQRFPKLGYVPTAPGVTITNLRSVVIERHSPTQPSQRSFPGRSFVIYFAEHDSLVIHSFTRTNVSRRILISVCGEPIAAPVLVSPIDTGSLVFDCTDPAVAERLQQQLTQMAREKPVSPPQSDGR